MQCATSTSVDFANRFSANTPRPTSSSVYWTSLTETEGSRSSSAASCPSKRTGSTRRTPSEESVVTDMAGPAWELLRPLLNLSFFPPWFLIFLSKICRFPRFRLKRKKVRKARGTSIDSGVGSLVSR